MAIERAVFDPDEIDLQLQRDLASGLRTIANAIDAGRLDGRVCGCQANGFGSARDTRAHVLVKLDLAAEIFSETESADELGAGGNISLPADSPTFARELSMYLTRNGQCKQVPSSEELQYDIENFVSRSAWRLDRER